MGDGFMSIKYAKGCYKEEGNNPAGAGHGGTSPSCSSNGTDCQDGTKNLLGRRSHLPGLPQVQQPDRGRAHIKCLRAPSQSCFYSFTLLCFHHPSAGMNHALQRQRSTGAARRLPIRIASTGTSTQDGHGKLGLVPK